MEAHRPNGSIDELPPLEAGEYETTAEAVTEAPQELSIGEGELAAEAIMKQPIIAFERVSKAAETDKPVEKQYETRHEKKDEPATQQAVSVGSVLAGLQSRRQDAPKAQDLPQPQIAGSSHLSPVKAPDPGRRPDGAGAYRQAVQAGFAVALAVILAFIVLQITT